MTRPAVRLALTAGVGTAVGWATAMCVRPRLVESAGMLVGHRQVRPAAGAGRSWALADIVATGLAVVAVVAYVLMAASALVALAAELSGSRRAARLAARGWGGPAWGGAAGRARMGRTGVVARGGPDRLRARRGRPGSLGRCRDQPRRPRRWRWRRR